MSEFWKTSELKEILKQNTLAEKLESNHSTFVLYSRAIFRKETLANNSKINWKNKMIKI